MVEQRQQIQPLENTFRSFHDLAEELFDWLVGEFGLPDTARRVQVCLRKYDNVVRLDPDRAGFSGAVGIAHPAHERIFALWLSAPEGTTEPDEVDVFDRDPLLLVRIGFIRRTHTSLYRAGCYVVLSSDMEFAGGAFAKALPLITSILERTAKFADKLGDRTIHADDLQALAERIRENV